ncbi:hypothetical protein EYF80_055283 [Liparis tanakae]|uniref:Uncharacterized protein n=1 Tax=Liparis tanakae TaxID=230148 RepID=A0A4Z2F0S9_9TELE|nr:hypothetical protein EYF80_055283 [Liparis tanakae]
MTALTSGHMTAPTSGHMTAPTSGAISAAVVDPLEAAVRLQSPVAARLHLLGPDDGPVLVLVGQHKVLEEEEETKRTGCMIRDQRTRGLED